MLNTDFLNKTRSQIQQFREKTQLHLSSSYTERQIAHSLQYIIPQGSHVLHVNCGNGNLLHKLAPSKGLGLDISHKYIQQAQSKRIPNVTFKQMHPEHFTGHEVFEYIVLSELENTVDVLDVLQQLKIFSDRHTRLIVIRHNPFWKPLYQLRAYLKKQTLNYYCWFAGKDLTDFLRLADYEEITHKKIVLLPFDLPLFSELCNKFLARLPLLRHLTFFTLTVARTKTVTKQDYSVSVIVPCRNEAGNVLDAVQRIPQLGKHTEIIFGDDKSTDGTAEKVKECQAKFADKHIKLVPGPAICKADNVWTSFDQATGDILMILDADLTMIPEELPYFYEAIAKDHGEFINGSRLVYPMHNNAMPWANVIGNKLFSWLFSYIMDTPLKDTLCGTKVMWRKDYARIKKLRGSWGIKDRWGDYELLFGAAKNHLKIIELPVHYMERVYGETKMTNRLKNGIIMLKMCLVSLLRIKFY